MTTYKQLIEKLTEDESIPPEEVAAVITEVGKAAAMKLYNQTIMSLTEEEQQQVENAQNEDEADRLLNQFYQLHYGKTPAEAMIELEEEFAQKFMEQSQTDNANTPLEE